MGVHQQPINLAQNRHVSPQSPMSLQEKERLILLQSSTVHVSRWDLPYTQCQTLYS